PDQRGGIAVGIADAREEQGRSAADVPGGAGKGLEAPDLATRSGDLPGTSRDGALSWPIAPEATAQHAQALVKEGQLRLPLAQQQENSLEDVRWLVGPGPEGLGEEAEAALNA